MAKSSTLKKSRKKAPESKPTTKPGFVQKAALRLFRISASLQLAIVLLSLFTLCLIFATLLESAYSADIARDLIYQTWWFFVLLVILGVNVLCAALKKYPWKKHQTGFLVTHLGLIVLVFGGLLTNLGGLEGQMNLIDTDNQEMQTFYHLSNTGDRIEMAREHQLEICRVPREAYQDPKLLQGLTHAFIKGHELSAPLKEQLKDDYTTVNFWPGSLPWHADQYLSPKMPASVKVLQWLANPAPGLSHDLDNDVGLEVENFYPHAFSQPFRSAEDKEEGFPALEIQLSSAVTGRPDKRWVTSLPNFIPEQMPINFEMFVLPDLKLLSEFLNPPKKLGKLGQLVLLVGPERKLCRIQLDGLKPGQVISLTSTLKLKVRQVGNLLQMSGQGSHHARQKKQHMGPNFPAVQYVIESREGKGTYLSCARMPHLPPLQAGQDVAALSAWYHYPDFRWGAKSKMGALQFLRTPGHRLYYRVYGKEGLKGKGKKLDPKNTSEHALPWGPMKMRFQILSWIPHATKKPNVIPKAVPLGAQLAEPLQPALRCTLHNQDVKKEFRVIMSRQAAKVTVGKNIFFVRYRRAARSLDFRLTLNRSIQTNDPGTQRAGAYESNVTLIYKKEKHQIEEDHTISMNRPLNYGQYKVYQTEHQPMMNPRTLSLEVDGDRIVCRSGLMVAFDPGLWAKYVGSALLVLGIAIMFYMRAYFFKRR